MTFLITFSVRSASGNEMFNAGFWMLDVECLMLDVECCLMDIIVLTKLGIYL